MGAAHHGRMPVLPRLPRQHRSQRLLSCHQQLGRGAQLQRLARINHIIRGQPVMQPARLGSDTFGDGGGEGNDIMLHLRLDGLNALQAEAAAGANGARRLDRDQAQLGLYFSGGLLHFQPLPEAIFIRPDAAHLRAGVAGNHKRQGN